MADNLTPEQRSYCMSRVKPRDTNLERQIRSALHRRGLRFRKHLSRLPGRPDIVFPREKVVVFIDGDFWHGYRFPVWKARVSEFWRRKIAGNRARDRRTFTALRRRGWVVIRIWQHAVTRDLETVVANVVQRVLARRSQCAGPRAGVQR